MPAAEIALLCVLVGVLLWRATMRERRDYVRFKRLRSTTARQKVLRRWLVESVLVLGGLAAATLVGAWTSVGPVLEGAQRWEVVAAARDWLATPAGSWGAGAAGVVVVVGLVLPILLLRGKLDDVPTVGDVRAILPRTRGELPYGAGLAIQAGVLEELLFRLALPALIFAVSGSALLAFAGSLLLFGLLHLYQGPVGMLFATLLGAVFTALYVISGSIWIPIALHVLVDLRSLVLIPIALGGVLTRTR